MKILGCWSAYCRSLQIDVVIGVSLKKKRFHIPTKVGQVRKKVIVCYSQGRYMNNRLGQSHNSVWRWLTVVGLVMAPVAVARCVEGSPRPPWAAATAERAGGVIRSAVSCRRLLPMPLFFFQLRALLRLRRCVHVPCKHRRSCFRVASQAHSWHPAAHS